MTTLRCSCCSRPIPLVSSAWVWRHRQTREVACSDTCKQMPESLQAGGGEAWELVEAPKAATGRAA